MGSDQDSFGEEPIGIFKYHMHSFQGDKAA
jgi:hypothetical protein